MLLATTLLAALAPLAASPSVASPPSTQLEWHSGALSNAVGKARHSKQMVMLYFWMDGSESCKTLWQDTLGADAAPELLDDLVLYSAQHGTAQGGALFERYNVQILPSLVFLTPDGEVEDLIGGVITAKDLQKEIARIRRGEGTVSDLRAQAAAHTAKDAAAFKARFALADRLTVLGAHEEADEVFASILADDPEGKTKIGAELHLEAVFKEVAHAGGGKKHMADWDLAPVKKHLKGVAHDAVRFQGWNKIGNVEAERAQVAQACDAFAKAWEDCPEDQVFWWAADVSAYIVKADGERTKAHKKLALDLAKAAVEAGETLTCEYKDQGCECDACTNPDGLVAKRMAGLARAYRLAGKDKKALATAEKCVAMDPDGGHDALVKELQAG